MKTRKVINEAEIDLDNGGDETELELDSSIDLKSASNDIELLSRCQEFIDKTAGDLNKIGIIMGSKFNDHSTRNSLNAAADQLQSIVHSLNERMVRISAKNEVDVTNLFPGTSK